MRGTPHHLSRLTSATPIASALQLTPHTLIAPPPHTTKTHNNSTQDEKRRENIRNYVWHTQVRSVYLCKKLSICAESGNFQYFSEPSCIRRKSNCCQIMQFQNFLEPHTSHGNRQASDTTQTTLSKYLQKPFLITMTTNQQKKQNHQI